MNNLVEDLAIDFLSARDGIVCEKIQNKKPSKIKKTPVEIEYEEALENLKLVKILKKEADKASAENKK